MFGRNDFVENVKSALAAVDCDMGAFRSWQKMYDKLKKKKSEQEDRYRRCREQTKNREENQSSGLLLLQTQALSYENCEAVEKCLSRPVSCKNR